MKRAVRPMVLVILPVAAGVALYLLALAGFRSAARRSAARADQFESQVQSAIARIEAAELAAAAEATEALRAFADGVEAEVAEMSMTDTERQAAAIARRRQQLDELFRRQQEAARSVDRRRRD